MDPAVEQDVESSSWTSALPSSFTQAGLLAANKGMSIVQPKMGPWSELATCNYSKPQGLMDAKSRVFDKVSRFKGNYAAITCVFASMFVIGHPVILVALVVLGAGWAYLLRRTDPVVLMGRELGEKQSYTLMGLVSLLVFVILGAVEVVMNGMFWGAIFCCIHAIFHEQNSAPFYDPLATVESTLTGELKLTGDLSGPVLDLEAATADVKVADF